jgi:hypothetical protein
MRKVSIFFAAALTAAAALAYAPAAQAQSIREIARVRWIGGFTAYNDTATVYASLNAAGAITAGFVRVDRKVHSHPTALAMTSRLTARETYDLWLGCYSARPWINPEVQSDFLNTDLPDVEVRYLGVARYTQKIRAGMVGPSNLPRVSSAMKTFIQQTSSRVLTVAGSPLIVYEARGGRQGYERQIAVTQGGEITDDVNYLSAAFAGQAYQKQGHVGVADLLAIKAAVNAAGWGTLADFPGNPSFVDGIDEQVSVYSWGSKKTVKGGWPTNRTAAYQAVIDALTGQADQIP